MRFVGASGLARRRVLVVAGVVVGAALLWFVGPLVVVAGVAPLAGEPARLAAIAARVYAAGEPLRRRALETAAAAAIVDREALIRAQNKARFKP